MCELKGVMAKEYIHKTYIWDICEAVCAFSEIFQGFQSEKG